MIRTSRRGFLAATVSVATLPATAQAQRRDPLSAGFMTPPDSAKPRVWWHWMNGNVTREGIVQDFAWMKRVGIGGVQNFDAALDTPQVVPNRLVYMSPEWKDTFKFAVERAERLDLEFAIAASPGWSETGGPWVRPEDAMKKVVWSETIVQGGARFNDVLPAPPSVSGPFADVSANPSAGAITPREHRELPHFYQDTVVLAYPAPNAALAPRPQEVTSNDVAIDPAPLFDGRLDTGVNLPAARGSQPAAIQYNFSRAPTICSATVFVANMPIFSALGIRALSVESSSDGRNWRKLADVKVRSAPTTVSFEPVTARFFRLAFSPAPPPDMSAFTMAPGVDLSGLMGATGGGGAPPQQVVQFELFSQPRVNAFETKAAFALSDDYSALDEHVGADVSGVPTDAIIDLSEHLDSDGRLDWTFPPGRWKVVRLGCSLTGKTNHPATAEATGLEVDKYDAQAVERYITHYLDMYRDAVGSRLMGARGLRALLTDSTEVGAANWTPRMLEQFQRLRGYDAKAWLPTLTGEIVGSRSQSDAFLHDFRQTLAELHTSEHYGTLARIAHERGMIVYGESLEGNRATLGDDLDMRRYADIPMGALWTYGTRPLPGNVGDCRGASSVAHLRGSTLVASESLTSIGQPYTFAPRDLQPMIDAIFAAGVNRPVIHTSVHQPMDRGPGLSLQVFGQYFSRLEAWAEMAKPWIDYISRNCYLLQQGRDVADVAYFYGEDTPVAVQASRQGLPDVPKRYAYDYVSASALTECLSVDNGDIVSRGGARYKVLYLNSHTAHMTLPTLRKLASLAEAGATIVGNAPRSSPSLKDDSAEFSQVVARLWGGAAVTEVGRGRVIAGSDVEGALAQIGVAPDFAYMGNAEIQFVHRRFDGGDLYFITNRTGERVQTEARFRVVGKAAELWHADTGMMEPTSYRIESAQTVVPLDLYPRQSVFVVFRAAAGQSAVTIATTSYSEVARIDGAWDVAFQSGRGAPASVALPELASLSENSDAGIKYFSGTSTYTKQFELPAGVRRGDALRLDLGAIGDIAEVRVNGRLVGTVWKAPYYIDIGPYVRSGGNTLDIRVANLWVNRLIGDQQEGAEKIGFTTVPTFVRSAPLRPSGLIGPVTLWAQV